MTSSFSPDLRLELMATGDQSGTWGVTTNTNLGTLLEQAICGVLSVAEGDTTLTLTTVNGGLDQARNAVVEVTGAMTAGRNVIVPTSNKLYLFKNSTSGGFAATIKTAAGTGVAVAAGSSQLVYCDGTNVVQGLVGTLATQAASAVAITGGTITGLTSLTLASGAATPATNDAAALGTASLSWSDLFLASGAVVNIANGNWVATHTSGILTVGTGDLRVTTAGTNSASVVTVGGTQTLTGKTLSGNTATNLISGSGTLTLNTTGTITVPNATDTLVGKATTDTLTNKTLVAPALGTPASGVMTNVTGTATGLTSGVTNALKSATTTVDVSAATAPSTGQILTATDSTHATWQAAASGGMTLLSTLTPSAVASIDTGTLATSYVQFLVVIQAIKCASGNGAIQVAVSSDNGGSFDTAVPMSGGPTFAGQVDGQAIITSVADTAPKAIVPGTFGTAVGSFNTVGVMLVKTSATNKLRFSYVSGVNFASGTIKVYGVK